MSDFLLYMNTLQAGISKRNTREKHMVKVRIDTSASIVLQPQR